MTIQEKKKEIDQINEKLAALDNRGLLIIHTTITALRNRQQLDEYEQAMQARDSELAEQ